MLGAGFRPFFLLAALTAIGAALAWLAVLKAVVVVHGSLSPVDLHAHEMIFGFTSAVIAGFLLTAVKSWTGIAPASASGLAALVALFVVGRAAVVIEAGGGPRIAFLEALFLPALALAIAVPIVRSKNKRNFGVVAVIAVLALMDVAMHVAGVTANPVLAASARAGALMVPCVLLAVVGGRVIPLFTRNVVTEAGATVRATHRIDALAIAGAVGAAVVVVAAPWSPAPTAVAPFVLVVAGLATIARMIGWASIATSPHPILWVLHVGHLCLGLGLLSRGVAFVAPGVVPPSAAMHVLSLGALSLLCLGMMTRVALGHTGRALALPRIAVVSYVFLLAALVARVAATWAPALLDVAALAFAFAFAFFLVGYAKILVTPRPDRKPG